MWWLLLQNENTNYILQFYKKATKQLNETSKAKESLLWKDFYYHSFAVLASLT